MSKILILLLYLFFITFCAYPAWNDYNVRAINNIEGLPDKHVNQILQDSLPQTMVSVAMTDMSLRHTSHQANFRNCCKVIL